MRTTALIAAAVAKTFETKLGGEATAEALRPYSDAIVAELSPKLGEGVTARAVADCDNENIVVTVKMPGQGVRETTTIPFAQIEAKAPPRRKTDDNPAPEVAPAGKGSPKK